MFRRFFLSFLLLCSETGVPLFNYFHNVEKRLLVDVNECIRESLGNIALELHEELCLCFLFLFISLSP